jgi:hypothetical protein
MSCQRFRTEIEEAARGASLGGRAAAHLAACDSCRALRVEGERLRALVADLARVEAPADFEFRLRARMARAEESRARSPRRSFVPGAAWLTVAGCLVLALGLFVHFRAGATREQNGNAQNEASARAVSTDHSRANQTSTQADAQARTDVSEARPADVRSPLAAVQTNGGQPKINGAARVKFVAARQSSRAERAARAERFVLPAEAVAEIAGGEPSPARRESRTMDVKPTRIYVGSPIPLPVASSDRKLEALFNDAHGAKHVVAVDPVAFGARGQAAKDANVKNVSYAGVW